MVTLPNLLPLVLLMVTVMVLALALVSVATAEFFVSNHKIRVTRRQSIPTYYRQLVGAH